MSYKAWTWNRGDGLQQYLEAIQGTRMAPKIRRLQRRARKLFERRRVAALIAEGCDDYDRDVAELEDLFEEWVWDRAMSEHDELALAHDVVAHEIAMDREERRQAALRRMRDIETIGDDLDDEDESESDKGSSYDDDDPIHWPHNLARRIYDDYDWD